MTDKTDYRKWFEKWGALSPLQGRTGLEVDIEGMYQAFKARMKAEEDDEQA